MPAPAPSATTRCRRGSGCGAWTRPRPRAPPRVDRRRRRSGPARAGRNTRCGSRVAQAAPTAAPASAVSGHRHRGAQVGPHPARVRRAPPSRCRRRRTACSWPGSAPARPPAARCSSAGSCISPPPPTTASTQPATSAARHEQPRRRAGDVPRQVEPGHPAFQPSTTSSTSASRCDHGVRRDVDRHLLAGGDVRVRHEDGPHAHPLGAVDVLVGAVADVDAAPAGRSTPTARIAARNASGCGLAWSISLV